MTGDKQWAHACSFDKPGRACPGMQLGHQRRGCAGSVSNAPC